MSQFLESRIKSRYQMRVCLCRSRTIFQFQTLSIGFFLKLRTLEKIQQIVFNIELIFQPCISAPPSITEIFQRYLYRKSYVADCPVLYGSRLNLNSKIKIIEYILYDCKVIFFPATYKVKILQFVTLRVYVLG